MVRPARRTQPSQSQNAGPSRSQKGERRLRIVESDDEEQGEQIAVDDDGSDNEEDHGHDAFQQKANDLVRLALFNEARRMPLKREDINKKVMHNSRNFIQVFALAQRILDQTFGLELQELPSKAGLDQEAAEAAAAEDNTKKGKKSGTQAAQDETDELEEARRATAGRKKAAAGSKTYILRSTLNAALIEQAMQIDAEIVEEEAVLDFGTGDFFGGESGRGGSATGAANGGALLDGEEWDDDAEIHPRTTGSILSWSQTDQLGALGVLYVILSLILVNGKVIDERLLRTQLKELGLPSISARSPIHHTTLSTHRSMKVDEYLSQLLRQGYLDRQVVGEVTGAGRKRARGKVGGDGREEGNSGEVYEWRWGARAFCEVGEKDVAKFVAEFMVKPGTRGNTGEDEDEDEGSERRKAKVGKMLQGVAKAAGGNLAPIRDWQAKH